MVTVFLRSDAVATAVEMENASLYLQMLEGMEQYRKIRILLESDNESHRLMAEQWAAEFAALDEVETSVKAQLTVH